VSEGRLAGAVLALLTVDTRRAATSTTTEARSHGKGRAGQATSDKAGLIGRAERAHSSRARSGDEVGATPAAQTVDTATATTRLVI
jgi:hypothetical protein